MSQGKSRMLLLTAPWRHHCYPKRRLPFQNNFQPSLTTFHGTRLFQKAFMHMYSVDCQHCSEAPSAVLAESFSEEDTWHLRMMLSPVTIVARRGLKCLRNGGAKH